ncbi:hypothetical protein FB451DRAFT_1552386 [Mycena latifolia]|nr:hypothetical protein FB451DRAFT_1552386 [Mycena latifolia]
MDSTPRGSKTISQWLPNEIITQTIQAVPRRADQGVLCRTSKLLHGLGAPVLYRAMDLRTYASIDAVCSTVLSNPALAELVAEMLAGAPRSEKTLSDPSLAAIQDCKISMFSTGHEIPGPRHLLEFRYETWISWYWDEDEEPDDLGAIGLALNSMTRTEVPFISSNDIFEHDNSVMEIFHTLSMHIPRTKTLHLQLFDLHSVSDTITTLENCLPSFLAGIVVRAHLWLMGTIHEIYPSIVFHAYFVPSSYPGTFMSPGGKDE